MMIKIGKLNLVKDDNQTVIHNASVRDGKYTIEGEEFSAAEFHAIVNGKKTKEQVYADR